MCNLYKYLSQLILLFELLDYCTELFFSINQLLFNAIIVLSLVTFHSLALSHFPIYVLPYSTEQRLSDAIESVGP
jgi:hypothetical protein